MNTSLEFSELLAESFENGNELSRQGYRGRFAPSPTGSLHVGNLRTALVSWLRARVLGGEWILRIDDLDRSRSQSEAIESIKDDLLWLGLSWDGPAIFQSKRVRLYKAAISALRLQGKIYPCRCTRSVLQLTNTKQNPRRIYPGTCRNLKLNWGVKNGRLPSLRLRVDAQYSNTCGDIILRRSDGFIAYHLATVIDELSLGINEIIRGEDLIQASQSQLSVVTALHQKPLNIRYAPVWWNADGTKLSKRNGGFGLDTLRKNGMTPSKVISLLASSLNLVPEGSDLSLLELLYEIVDNDCNLNKILTS